MELHGDRLIPAPVATTWAALNDPETLKGCIAGCESLERTGDDAYTAVVALKIGPVSARFKGNLKMTDVVPPTGYTINFDGQGGVAGFGRGSADVRLAARGRRRDSSYLRRPRPGRRKDGADRLAPDRRHGRQDHRRLLQGVRSAARGADSAGGGAGRAGGRCRRVLPSRRARSAGCWRRSSSSRRSFFMLR